jgi:hypothetical protein
LEKAASECSPDRVDRVERQHTRAVSKCTNIIDKLVATSSLSIAEMLLKIRASTWLSNDDLELGEGLDDLEDANNLIVGLHDDLERLRAAGVP